MIEFNSKEDCCGCTACYSICPKRCISMLRDEEGFLYPCIDETKCVNCHICETVCPVLVEKPKNSLEEAVIVQNKNESILYESASGGAFSALAEVILRKGGVAYGAAYTSEFRVVHKGTNISQEVGAFRSSKYVQSDLGDSFLEIKSNLDNEIPVCFSGTPCQVAGLKGFLKKDYSNLYTVDLVCKGVSSPEVLKQYTDKMQEKYDSKILSMNFKRKTYGYHSSTMSIDFENGASYSGGGVLPIQ